MGDSQPQSDALRRLIDSVGREQAPDVAARAQAEAVARATAVLAEEMAKSILDHVAPVPTGGGNAQTPLPTREVPRPEAEASVAGAGQQGGASQHGVWVYGIVERPGPELLDAFGALPGVAPGGAPELLEHGGFAAIASFVPMAEFGEGPLRENLNDVEWLERIARAHEAVLEAAMQVETVVPLRICTIYASIDHVREMLDERGPMFADTLRCLAGRAELGVKLVAEPGALARAIAPDPDEVADGDGSPGLEYIRERGRDARVRDEADQLAAEWMEEVHAPLAAIAAEALLNPPQNPELSGHAGEMLLNGVYLVEDDRRLEFAAEAERLRAAFAHRDATVELTGPWPPYNFVNGAIEAAR